jgi:hypothetical protein
MGEEEPEGPSTFSVSKEGATISVAAELPWANVSIPLHSDGGAIGPAGGSATQDCLAEGWSRKRLRGGHHDPEH